MKNVPHILPLLLLFLGLWGSEAAFSQEFAISAVPTTTTIAATSELASETHTKNASLEEKFEKFCEGQNSLVLLLILMIGIAILVKGADWLVEGAVGLSEQMGIPKVIIGATVVSLGTTTPEAAVSVMAAFKGMPDFALGNSVGSIICDTGLIFGICMLVTRLPIDRYVLNRQGWVQFGAGVLLVIVSLLFVADDGVTRIIPRSIGALFMALLVGYLLISVYWARQHRKHEIASVEVIEKKLDNLPGQVTISKNLIFLFVGLTMVLIASQISLATVKVLCVRWGVPRAVVAATLVAFGTSLPELVTAITSIRKGHKELLIGNIIGADILNVLFVTGAAACATTLTVEPIFFKLLFPVMMAYLIMFRLLIHFCKASFARWPGFVFLGLYIFYAVANYAMGK